MDLMDIAEQIVRDDFPRAQVMQTTANFYTGYMDEALTDLNRVIEIAKTELVGLDFDTIVGTGFSGGCVVPALAMALGKKYVLVRKLSDDSHHGGGRLLGTLGNRWLFVDDFVGSGTTRQYVLNKIAEACVMNGHTTSYMGTYCYTFNQSQKGYRLPIETPCICSLNDDGSGHFTGCWNYEQ